MRTWRLPPVENPVLRGRRAGGAFARIDDHKVRIEDPTFGIYREILSQAQEEFNAHSRKSVSGYAGSGKVVKFVVNFVADVIN